MLEELHGPLDARATERRKVVRDHKHARHRSQRRGPRSEHAFRVTARVPFLSLPGNATSLARGLVLLLLSGLAILAPLGPGAEAAEPDSTFPAPTLFVSPGGNDQGSCSQASPCAGWNAAYQRAAPGQVIGVAGGTYPTQVIQGRESTADLHPGCTPETPTNCIVFQVDPGHVARINGALQVNGSSVWIDGTTRSSYSVPARGRMYSIRVSGFVDTEATSLTDFPDHVIVQGIKATSFGVFDVHTAVFRDMDIGPATVGANCQIEQGTGFENKIGYAGGIRVAPTNVTLDRLIVHNQNRDRAGAASDCHFGGLFLVTARGLTIEKSVFSQNAVYNIQVQNFGGAPPPTQVTIQDNWFGCPVIGSMTRLATRPATVRSTSSSTPRPPSRAGSSATQFRRGVRRVRGRCELRRLPGRRQRRILTLSLLSGDDLRVQRLG